MGVKSQASSVKIYKIRLKKGDSVIVLAGKDKSKTGKIIAVHPTLNKVTVEGINMAKKHQKPNKLHPQGAILEITKPIWVSKVAIVDPSTKKAARIVMKVDKEGKKTRTFHKSGKEILSVAKAKEGKK